MRFLFKVNFLNLRNIEWNVFGDYLKGRQDIVYF